MPKEKTLEEKLAEASSAVERALEARDKAIQPTVKCGESYTTRGRSQGVCQKAELTRWRARW